VEFGVDYGTRGKNPYKSSFMAEEPVKKSKSKRRRRRLTE
jgi:hypothetical protein